MQMNEVETLLQNISGTSLFFAETIINKLPSQILDVFHKIEIDIYGNLHFIKNGKGQKIQILFRCEPNAVLLGQKTENKFHVTLLGKKKQEDLQHTIVYQNETKTGSLRLNKNAKIYLESYGDFDDEINDICTIENEVFCKDDLLYGNELSSVYPLILIGLLSEKIRKSEKYMDFTVWNNSLSKESGGIATCKACNANQLVVFSNIKSCDKHPVSQGPLLVFKDGSYIATKDTQFLIRNNPSYRSFVGKTDKFLEQLSIQCHNAKILGVYLPVRQENDCTEIMDFNDIKKAGELLLKNFLLL